MSRMLGIIAGSAFLDDADLPDTRRETVTTAQGDVVVQRAADYVFLKRHGTDTYRPPHRIPHHAHVLAMEALGVTHVAGIASTGALRDPLRPGDVVIPADYISLHPPPTFAGDEYLHIVPALDAGVRDLLGRAATAAATEPRPRILHGGVYVQTSGPRFETAAEVRMLARDADIVGMTAASEATLCQERGIAYAVLCMVDNYANGVGTGTLTLEGFQQQVARNSVLARRVVASLITEWRNTP